MIVPGVSVVAVRGVVVILAGVRMARVIVIAVFMVPVTVSCRPVVMGAARLRLGRSVTLGHDVRPFQTAGCFSRRDERQTHRSCPRLHSGAISCPWA